MLISEQHIEGGEAADDFEVLEMIAYRQEGVARGIYRPLPPL